VGDARLFFHKLQGHWRAGIPVKFKSRLLFAGGFLHQAVYFSGQLGKRGLIDFGLQNLLKVM
jgi:hypothetical protein